MNWFKKLLSKPSSAKEWLVLTSDYAQSAGRSRGEDNWTAVVTCLAWIDQTGQLKQSKQRLVWQVSEEDFQAGQYSNFENLTIYRILVDLTDQGVTLVKVLDEAVSSPELEAVREVYLTPVTYTDSMAGQLILDKGLSVYETRLDWRGHPIDLIVEATDQEIHPISVSSLHRLLSEKAKWEEAAREQTSQVLLDLAEHWAQEGDAPLTQQSFSRRLTLLGLTVQDDGGWVMEFDDDEIFGCHHILVTFDQDFHFLDAEI